MNEWMNNWMNEMNEWMNERTNEWMNEWIVAAMSDRNGAFVHAKWTNYHSPVQFLASWSCTRLTDRSIRRIQASALRGLFSQLLLLRTVSSLGSFFSDPFLVWGTILFQPVLRWTSVASATLQLQPRIATRVAFCSKVSFSHLLRCV